MNVVLISTYELGRQPFGLASPAAWLEHEGATVTCLDLAVEKLDHKVIRNADLVAFYIPMHTATRLAMSLLERVQRLNSDAHICFFGLYAPVNEVKLRELGADTILGGEFEEGLVSLVERLGGDKNGNLHQPEPVVSFSRQAFVAPNRSGLPRLSEYAFLTMPDGSHRVTGYTEATRGCKHLCRHCPVVPVYGGQFRIVQRDVVLADIEQQVAAGAQHITFGDPDFFNGPGHAVKIAQELQQRWPELSYDVTIKIEHLLQHQDKLRVIRDTGCVLVTSAVESVDDHILEVFDKRHTREEFERVVDLCREHQIALNPTFVAFTPWTSLDGYLDLLQTIAELDLVQSVSPIQYAIRLLIPNGSALLDHPETHQFIREFDDEALVYPWVHPDPVMDELQRQILKLVESTQDRSRQEIFAQVVELVSEYSTPAGALAKPNHQAFRNGFAHPPVPYISEPWYC